MSYSTNHADDKRRFCPACDKLPPPEYNKVTGEIIAPRLMKI